MDRHQQRVPGLDAIRFAAAALVMAYHLLYWRNGDTSHATEVSGNAVRFGWVGVEIFFALSGFVIAFSAANTSAEHFARSRFLRLVPTVWICATITLIFLLANPPKDLLVRYVATIFFKPVGFNLDVVYWTLGVEVDFYLFVFAVLRLTSFRTLVNLMVTIGLLSTVFNAALFWSTFVHPGETNVFLSTLSAFSRLHTSRLLLVRHGCFFALGVLLWASSSELRPAGLRCWMALLLIGTVTEVFTNAASQPAWFRGSDLGNNACVAWLCGFSAICIVSRPTAIRFLGKSVTGVRLLRYLGLLTFPVYLIHNEIGLSVQSFFGWLPLRQAIVVSVAASLLIAMAVCFWLEPPLSMFMRHGLEQLSGRLSASPKGVRLWRAVFGNPNRSAPIS